MTVHDLHDALTLLPGDLVTATDRLRTAPKQKVIPWRRWVSLAACLVLVLSVTLVFRSTLMAGSSADSVAQAPAAAAPMMESGKLTATEAPAAAEPAAPQEAPAEDAAGSMNSSAQTMQESAAEEELIIDHSHRFAEEPQEDKPAAGYCGNMQATIFLDGGEITLSGGDAVTITDILANLDYDPEALCRCMAEFTVDTELLAGIEVNLTEGFARCDRGQAALTREQAAAIQEIIQRLS